MESIDASSCSLNLLLFAKKKTPQQRYGYKNAALDAKEKAKLQAEILELIFAHGESEKA